jgi:glycosyltransferase involved in cell wall biosynthesis
MQVSQESSRSELLRRVAVLIPCWRPDHRLVELVRSLAEFPFSAIVVLNDGSDHTYEEFFERVRAIPSAIVLKHDKNRGQGCAVKTAMRYVVDNLPNVDAAVTADADGQHAVKDIVRIAEAAVSGDSLPVLGTRTFGAGVPLRSRIGNITTQYVFRLLSGTMITDTQSGLRGVPRQWLPAIIGVKGDRFEFAVSVLAQLCWLGVPPREVPIETIYIDQNRSSHFNPLRDSVRIYSFLFRLYAASLLPMCVDFVVFLLVYAIGGTIAVPVLAGRAAAISTAALIHSFEGARRKDVSYSLVLHILSLCATGLLSFSLIMALVRWIGMNVIAAKVLAEAGIGLLFAVSFKKKRPVSG